MTSIVRGPGAASPDASVNILSGAAVPPPRGTRRRWLALVLAALASGCQFEDRAPNQTAEATLPAAGLVYGEAVGVGQGFARSYVILENGSPVELGVAVDERAMASLPQPGSPGAITMPDGLQTFQYTLPMPAGHGTPFDHVMLDWNPGGHEPPGVYTVAHFDFHFYLIGEAERTSINPADPQFAARAARHPPAEQLPAGFIAPVPDAVPMMGLHWIDAGAPELAGAPFDKTFLYGTWDGKLAFVEPMITKAFLDTKQEFSSPIATPQAYARPGLYPTSYRIRWDAAATEHRIALGGFQTRG